MGPRSCYLRSELASYRALGADRDRLRRDDIYRGLGLCAYDEQGQLLTRMLDYLVPMTAELPDVGALTRDAHGLGGSGGSRSRRPGGKEPAARLVLGGPDAASIAIDTPGHLAATILISKAGRTGPCQHG